LFGMRCSVVRYALFGIYVVRLFGETESILNQISKFDLRCQDSY
jgi:hypothetical protein